MTRYALPRLLLAAAAILLVADPGRAEKPPASLNPAAPTPELFVKDGDKFRPATTAELGAGEAYGTHGGDKTDFIDIKRYDLGIYTLLVFGILYLFIQFKVWPHISEGLKKREAGIQGARDEAQKARQDAEELRVKLQKDYADAQDKIRVMLDEARKDAGALRATEREAGAKDAQAERERAKKEIEAAKEAALQDLYQQAVQLASLLSAKTIRRQLSPDDHRRLLDESLAEMKGGIGSRS